MSLESALRTLRLEPRFMRNVVRWVQVPPRPAAYGPWPVRLSGQLRAALRTQGIEALYRHQAKALDAALRGEHVAVVTAAASGKTLCYNLPVLNRLLLDPGGRALYLFPTKALAQDQLAALHGLIGALPLGSEARAALTPATYDGDTSSARRRQARDRGRIILSNPDMLHMGILPQHPRWAAFFANLRVVVIDEMHVYRGVFGSHVANVLRRLRRVCRFYGSEPQFVLASATVANPDELARRLVAAPVGVIGPEQDGAPQGARHLLFYNPPMIDPALGIRRSSSAEATELAAHLIGHDVQTIVFARARMTTELILASLRERVPQPSAVQGYRGGYLPAERRAIERGLRNGSVRGVVATNALELGVDIGQLDAAVLAGYPGSIASLRQQIGRAGRRQSGSLAVVVASAGALDQYMIAHPEYLLATSPEHALVNPDNEIILAGHLACAAAELPMEEGERLSSDLSAESQRALLNDLVAAGQLYRAGERYYWAGEGVPAAALGLRTGTPDRVMIQMTDRDGKPQIIGEVDRPSVPLLLYEGAIYMHQAATYQVKHLDWEMGVAHVEPVTVDFFTRPAVAQEVTILAERDSKTHAGSEGGYASDDEPPARTDAKTTAPGLLVAWGEVRVRTHATGFRIIRRTTNEILGFGEIDLPDQVLETEACWLAFPEAMVAAFRSAGVWLSDPNEYGPNWPAQRRAARSRDGYRCQGCGALEPAGGREHDVHHRIPFRAFVADPRLRPGLSADQAWQAANHLDNLVTLCPTCHRQAEASVRTRSGLGGLAWLLAGVAPVHLMCDPGDLGQIVEPKDPTTGLPTITFYERVPGGLGYAQQMYASMPELLEAAHELVQQCPCDNGCPACVGPVLEHEHALDSKRLAAALLARLCGDV